MTQNITKIINEEEKIMLETAALFFFTPAAMLHGLSIITWLPKPSQMAEQ
jgi:hypothetical protein